MRGFTVHYASVDPCDVANGIAYMNHCVWKVGYDNDKKETNDLEDIGRKAPAGDLLTRGKVNYSYIYICNLFHFHAPLIYICMYIYVLCER